MIGNGLCKGLLRGSDDRAVSSASTQVARKSVIQGFAIDSNIIGITSIMQRGQTHHDTRGAKAALGAMGFGHLDLNWVRLWISQVLDSKYLGAIDCTERNNAGVNRLVMQLVIFRAAQQYRAGAAVSFGAAFFGAGQPLVEPQEIQQCLLPIEGIQCNFLVAKQTAECRSCGCHRAFGQTRQLPR